jgi:hypothetical protein
VESKQQEQIEFQKKLNRERSGVREVRFALADRLCQAWVG